MSVRLVSCVLLVCLCTSCGALSTIRRAAIPPTATVTAGATTVTQRGEAQTPATASSNTQTQTMTLPAGSVVWQDETTGSIRYQLSRDTPITTATRIEKVNAPAAFTPPQPPTVADESAARADYWTTLGLRAAVLVGAIAGIFGLVKAWPLVMWGGVAVCTGGLFGLFVQRHPLLLALIGIGLALKFVGPLLWHTKLKHTTAPIPE